MVLEENELGFDQQRMSGYSTMSTFEARAKLSLTHCYRSLKHLLT